MMGNFGQHTGTASPPHPNSHPIRVLCISHYSQIKKKLNGYTTAVNSRDEYLCIRIMQIFILCQDQISESQVAQN